MLPSWFSFIDVAYLVVVGIFAWGGMQKGFAAQLARFFTFLGIAALLFFAYPFLFEYFGRVFRNLDETFLMWLLLLGLAAAGFGVFVLISKLLEAAFKAQMSDTTDAVWGFIFGLLHGGIACLIGMIVLVMIDRSGVSYDKFRMKSYVGKTVCYQLVPRVQPRLTALYEDRISDWKAELLRREEAASEVEM